MRSRWEQEEDGHRRRLGGAGPSARRRLLPGRLSLCLGRPCHSGQRVARPASGQVISLRPTVTGPRCSQLEGGWVDILRESSLFFLTEPSQASIHGGVPRHLPAPQLPEVTGHTSPAASTDVLAQCFQK